MKDTKILIMFMLLIVIALIVFLLLIKIPSEEELTNTDIYNEGYNLKNEVNEKINDSTENKVEYDFDYDSPEGVTTEFDNFLESLNNISEYCTIEEILSQFYKDILEENSEKLVNTIDKSYISQHGLNRNNIIEYLKNNQKYQSLFCVQDIYITQTSNTSSVYYVKGFCYKEEGMDEIKNEYFCVKINYDNRAYSIIPIEYIEYTSGVNDMIKEQKDVELNRYNKYEWKYISDDNEIKKIFEKNKIELLYNSKVVYEKLNSEYKNKRFQNINDLNKYISENYSKIKNAIIMQYSVNQKNGYKEYVCVDQYDNYYIFNQTSVMNYTVLLDNYTIESDEFLKKYTQASNEEKCQINIDKFFTILKNKDYKTAYSYLSDGFKNKYFRTEDDFKNYIEREISFISAVNLNFEKIEIENDLYCVTTTISKELNGLYDGEGRKTISKTFIVKLGKGTDFELSFNVE